MTPGGLLDIATDHDEYAVQITRSLLRSPYFTSRLAKVFTLADEGRVQTKYEQVALLEGRTPRYYKWRRDESAVVQESFPIPKELAMPHVVLRLPADVTEIGRRFQPHAVAIDATRIRFVDAYQSLGDGRLLIETYINEEPLFQRLGLQLRARPTGGDRDLSGRSRVSAADSWRSSRHLVGCRVAPRRISFSRRRSDQFTG